MGRQSSLHTKFIRAIRQSAPAGVAVLLILVVGSVLLTGLTLLWRSASLSVESALICYRTRRNFYAVEGLALYGLALIRNRSIPLEKIKLKPQVIYQANWPQGQLSIGRLVASYNPKIKELVVQASLFDGTDLEPINRTQIICNVGIDGKLSIREWEN